MAKQTIQIADKPTLDEILALLQSSEIGLAVLRELLGNSADAETAEGIKSLLENTTYGLNALKAAITGRANETTVAAVKALLENGTYGLNALDKDLGTIAGYLTNTTYGLNALKTAISNADKYNNVSTGKLAVSKTITRSDYSSVAVNEYSSALSVSGNGEVLLLGVTSATDTRYINGSIYDYINDITIDGVKMPKEYFQYYPATDSAVRFQQFRFKFSKSFSCRYHTIFSWSSTAPTSAQIAINESIDYLVQTR